MAVIGLRALSLTLIAYQNCATDVTCSEATIRGYMDKFHQDCDQDGYEDCFDYAAVHFHGGYGCNKPLRVPVRNALSNCLQRSGGGDLPPFPDPIDNLPPPPPPVDPIDNLPPPPPPPVEEPTTYPQIDIRFKDE